MSQLTLEAVLRLVDNATAPLRQMMQSSSRAADQLNQTRNNLRELQRTAANVSSFQRVESQLGETRQSVQRAEQQLHQLQQQMQSTTRPTAAMRRELTQAERALNQLQAEEREQAAQLGALRSRLAAAGIGAHNMAEAEAELRRNIDRTTASLRQQQERMRRLQQARDQHARTRQQLSDTSGTGMSMMATGAATMAVAVKPIVEFASAEDAATQLKVSMMGIGGTVAPEFEQIKALANDLGNKLPGTTADFQTMMATLVQQGISYKAILGGVGKSAAYLGVQLKMPFDQAAEFAAKMQDATKTAEGDMLGLMDTIQRSSYLGVDSTNMLSGFSKLSAGMKTIRMQGLEGAKAMAPLLVMADQASMAGESAGNAYSKIFKSMLDTSSIAKELKGTGIKMDFTDGKGEFGGLDNMYRQLEKLKPLSTEKRLELLSGIFGNDAETIKALDLLIDKGKAGYDETVAKMQAQADLQTRVNEQLGTLKNLWDAATGTFSNALVAIGESVAPQVKDLVKWVGDLSEKLANWAKQNPALAGTILKVAAAIGAILFVLGTIAVVVSALLLPFAMMRFSIMMLSGGFGPISMLAKAFSWLGMTIRAVGFALAANPLLLALLLLATAAYLIYQNWEPIRDFFVGLWNSIVSATSAAIEAVVNWFSTGFARATAFVSSGIETIVGFFTGLYDRFMTAGGQIIQGLLDGLTAKWDALKAKVAGIAAGITDTVKGVLGIHSPSRVFAQLGGYTMAGLTQGILAGSGAPVAAVASTSDALRRSIDTSQIRIDSRAPLASSGTSGTAAGTSVAPITINVYATPGMDSQMLAQQVATELERTRQQQATRQRSALYDT